MNHAFATRFAARQHLVIAAVMIVFMGASAARAEIEAVTSAHADLHLGFAVPGRVIAKHVELGTAVKQGDVLIELDNLVGEAAIKVQKMRAENQVPKEAAEAELALANVELQVAEDLFRKNAMGSLEFRRIRSNHKVQQLRVAQADMEMRLAAAQLKQAEADATRYKMIAPIDGVIEKLEKEKGEDVAVGEPVEGGQIILRLVNVRKLHIDAAVPTAQTLNLKKGDKAWVRASMRSESKRVEGVVTHVAKIADYASRTRLVRIEIPNEQEHLGAGWHVVISFDEARATTAASHDMK